MRHICKRLFLALVVITFGLSKAAVSQSEPAAVAVPSRILTQVDDSKVIQLKGNVHPRALPQFDRGAVESNFPLDRMLLILERGPEQEAALEKFMAEQIAPGSSNFHHWLTPTEFGSRFGPSSSDVQIVTSWLQNHGFIVTNVSKGRVFIEFSGNAGQVQEAFHTEIHRFMVDGKVHIANVADPSIPAALRPAVSGIFSLHNFLSQPMHRNFGSMHMDSKTHKWTPVDEAQVAKPLYTVPNGGSTFELLTPYDFAKIYNVAPLWTAGFDGTGQTIAIAGRSDISLSDVATFRSSFGLGAKAPTIITNGADPGVPSSGDKLENTLDVEWSGAVAKNATIKFVTTKSTSTSDGAVVSATYIIDNNTAHIMSFSYGSCELQLGSSGNAAINSLWQQGAAEGMTIFVASGDQGSAVCDGGQAAPYAAELGLEVSGHSSTPYNVAVGGTDFNWANLTTTYWNSTNAANGSSALSYIPEVPWNGSCASHSLDQLLQFTAAGFDNEQTCQYMLDNNFDQGLVTISGGSGGKSHCTTPSSTTPASCSGGYAKPSWQTGTGVPADSKRDVPDVSLFASSGSLNTAYAICDTQSLPCTYSNTNDAFGQAVGGTSVASPAMAGIMALINQKMGAPQGNANAAFYALAARDTRSSCNTVSVASGNTCNFYDITTDNNAVPCIPGDADCTVHHQGDSVGILNGYNSTTGFDLATGLGSINANNLVNNWHLVVTTPVPGVSLTPTSITFPTTTAGATSVSTTVTLKNTGTASLTLTSIALAGTNPSDFTIPSKTCGATLAASASCTFTVAFKPAAASTTYHATVAVTDNASGSPQSVTLTGTSAGSGGATPLTLTPTSLVFSSVDVGTTTAAKSVLIKNGGATTVTFTGITITGTNATSFSQLNTCAATLAAGASCTAIVSFTPKSTGSLAATLSISSNASASAQTVALSGTATAQPTLVLNPTSISFATTAHGTTSKASVVNVYNSGTTTASLYAIVLSGANPTDFNMLTTCGVQLPKSGLCTIYVSFKPAAAAAYTGSVIVYSNGVGNPQTITLKGTGN